MTRRIKVAVLSDDAVFARMLELELKWRSYEVSDKKEADLLVIDADTQKTRPDSVPAVLFGRAERSNGADGVQSAPLLLYYLRRPFDMCELFALIDRIFSFSREAAASNGAGDVILAERGRVSVLGESVRLSDAEYELLELLLKNRGRALSREDLARAVFPDANRDSKVTDVYVCYLRRKIDERLGRPFIRTVRGKGYVIKD